MEEFADPSIGLKRRDGRYPERGADVGLGWI